MLLATMPWVDEWFLCTDFIMFTITKEVYFCYGHRLMNHSGKCRYVHGHSVKAAITLQQAQLDAQGMVCDFADVRIHAEHYIDDYLDHNLLLHKDDPLIPALVAGGERFLALDEHPTAEVLSKMIYCALKKLGLAVYEVTIWETRSACASYRE